MNSRGERTTAATNVACRRSAAASVGAMIAGIFTLLVLFESLSALAADAAEPAKSNSLKMTLVRIAAGDYQRGFVVANRRDRDFHLAHQYSNRQDFRNERPAHRVMITKPFDIASTEVTVSQFRAFVEASGYKTDAERKEGALGWFPDERDYVDRFHTDPKITWRSPGFPQSDVHPVTCVSWNDALAFCQWLSKKEDAVYRLPTEAEWEYCCRAGGEGWYAWGRDPDQAYQYANVADGSLEAAFPNTTQFQRAIALKQNEGDGVVFTAPTASYKANAWGLYDLHGNVWEWCADRWSADVYERLFDGVERRDREKLVVRDPLFDAKTEQHKYGDWRVMRGGAWTCAPAAVRCSTRTFAEAGDAAIYTGFRVVRSVAVTQ